MYNTPYFRASNDAEVIEFMRQHPFVIIAGCDEAGSPVATHVPVLLEEREGRLFLIAHIKKQTDHYRAFLNNKKVLVIFSGAQSYISASWYKNKQQASTWNYQAVHASGLLHFLGDDQLKSILTRLTAHFEKDSNSPSLVEHLAPDYVEGLMKAIVAFEIEVINVAHIFKMSQNKDSESYHNVVQQLHKGDLEARQVALAMEKIIVS